MSHLHSWLIKRSMRTAWLLVALSFALLTLTHCTPSVPAAQASRPALNSAPSSPDQDATTLRSPIQVHPDTVSTTNSSTSSSNLVDDGDSSAASLVALISPVVDTGQTSCYDEHGTAVSCANSGQDAQFSGHTPSYTNNGNGTITDNVTGLTWTQSPDTNGDGAINVADKKIYSEAMAYCEALTLGGEDNWRLPSITQLYSLIDFSGTDPSGYNGSSTANLTPFIDTDYFAFAYGDQNAGERIIDAQFASSTLYTADTSAVFGVNLADGRIKGYKAPPQASEKTFYVLCASGNPAYGENDFQANGDGTITDKATGLMWTQDDSGTTYNWNEALNYCHALTTAVYDDWRLPNAKELQSIVDYNRSPATTGSAALSDLFTATPITNEAGQTDYAAYWSSTTHNNLRNGGNAAYVNFGRALGYMNGQWVDVHGAGAQRSDPKSGDPSAYPTGHGPQGDAIRIYNMVRCVRDANGETTVTTPQANTTMLPVITNTTVPHSATDTNSATASPTATNPPHEPTNAAPDLTQLSAELGLSVETVRAALGDPQQGPPDLAAAAQQLGISEQALREAIGKVTGQQPPPRP